MIDLKLQGSDIATFQNSTLIRLLIEYKHAGAMLMSCSLQGNEPLREVLQQSARAIEQELIKREATSTMISHLACEGVMDAHAYSTLEP